MLHTLFANNTLEVDSKLARLWPVLITSLAIHFLSLALPVMTLQVYDRVLPNQSTASLQMLIIGVCIAIILETMLKLCRAYIIGWTGASFEHRLSSRLLNHILQADLKYLKQDGVGAGVQHLAAVSKVKDFYSGEIFVVVLEALFIIPFLVLIGYIGGVLVCVPLAILTVFGLVSYYFGRQLKQNLALRNECDDKRYNFLVQVLAGIHTIKSYGLEQIFRRRYEFMEQRSGVANLIVSQTSSTTFNSAAFFSHLMVVCVITIGALKVMDGQMSVGAMVACILLSGRIMQPVQKLLQLWVKSQDIQMAQQQISQTLATPIHQKEVQEQALALQKNTQASCTLEDISFRYQGQNGWLFHNLSANLKQGQSVFLDGHDGAGKSTLLKLIAGIHTPEKGVVKANGHELSDYSPALLAQYVAYISQSSHIFRGTIRDNLTRFGTIDDISVMEMVRQLGLHTDIARLPAGFDTHLEGLPSDTIAPGLKQRLAITRALAPKPSIILLDNADHGLDQNSTQIFYETLRKMQPHICLIIVSDDPEIQKIAAQKWLLHEGAIASQGKGASQ